MTAAQMAMIDFLRLSSGKKTVNQREIEQEFNIKSSTVTLLIDRMVAKNFIVRRESAKDKRVKEIFLTTKGFDISDVIKTIIQSHDSYVLNGYSDGERDVIVSFLKHVSKISWDGHDDQ
ncbi:MarR family winged helix-turn-helix transcriptional regulator [Leuconostoc pseudomesenteroides]